MSTADLNRELASVIGEFIAAAQRMQTRLDQALDVQPEHVEQIDDDPNWVPSDDDRCSYTQVLSEDPPVIGRCVHHVDHPGQHLPAPVEPEPEPRPIFDDWQLAADGEGVLRYPVIDDGAPRLWVSMGPTSERTVLTDEQLAETRDHWFPLTEAVILVAPDEAQPGLVSTDRESGTIRVRGSAPIPLGSIARVAAEMIRAGRVLQKAPMVDDLPPL